jgi:hypothetical protein
MPQEFLNFFQGPPSHNQVRSEGVPEVVKMEVLNSGPAAGALKGRTNIHQVSPILITENVLRL